MLYLLCLDGLCQNATHDEGSEGGRETGSGGCHHHAKAEGKGGDEQSLIVHQVLQLAEYHRDEIKTYGEPKY